LTLIIAIHLKQELYRDGSRGEEAQGMEQMRLDEACELSTRIRARVVPMLGPGQLQTLSRFGSGR
jgi:hypothetical protein